MASVSAVDSGATDPALAPRHLAPPLLRMLLPLIVAAIVIGVLFAWLFPPATPVGVPPVSRLIDVTEEAGINFSRAAGSQEGNVPTTLGGGVVFFDFDSDGDEDLFFVNGAPWPWEESLAKRVGRGCALFRNDGAGRFTDVTLLAELNVELQGMGAAAGDYDNDGLPDLYITCVGTNHLFRNRGDGRFEDITEEAGVGGDDNVWSTCAVWLDVDGDSLLDLVVGNYARWPREVGLAEAFTVARLGRSYGAPTGFIGALPSVYRNRGDGRFELLAEAAGLRHIDPQTGLPASKVLAVSPLDANSDGRLDLLFFYHTSDEALFLSQGDGTFRRGPATPGAFQRREGLSARVADPLPLTPTSGPDQRFAALLAAGSLTESDLAGGELNLPDKGGIALFDYDGDGWLDIFSTGGRAEPDVGRIDSLAALAAPPRLFWNRRDDWIEYPADPESEAWAQPLTARGAAVADIDGDGDLDVILTQNEGPPRLLRNEQRHDPPWLMIDLIATRSARDAGGARVEVHTPRRVQVQTVAPAMTLMAQSTRALHFGLGDDARVRRIVIEWPSGRRQEVQPAGINRRLVIEEP